MGADWTGHLTSDRGSAYNDHPLDKRQCCWSHLVRDVRGFGLFPRAGPIWCWAQGLLMQTDLLFQFWHEFRAGQLDRAQFQTLMAVVEVAVTRLLRAGTRLPHTRPAGWCNDLLTRGPALWTFVHVPGVEPTNNAAERALRPAVLWRKRCFGPQSSTGSRFVEWMLTVIATCRQLQRHLLNYLTAAVTALMAGEPAPRLLTTL